jgi:hypothetical protein
MSKITMPKGFPRLFVGDGVTKFKGPAMYWSPNWSRWDEAHGDNGCFEKGIKYALPPLRKRVSAREAAFKYLKMRGDYCHDLDKAVVYGWNAAMREMKRRGE